MQFTKIRHLIVLALIATVVGWAAATISLSSGWGVPVLPIGSAVTLFIMAVVDFILGWPIWRWNQGKRDKPLNPLAAARVLVLAKASSLVGAIFLGWNAGLFVFVLPFLSQPAWPDRLWPIILGAIAAVVLCVVGLIVEYFCRIPPEDDADAEGGTASSGGDAPTPA